MYITNITRDLLPKYDDCPSMFEEEEGRWEMAGISPLERDQLETVPSGEHDW